MKPSWLWLALVPALALSSACSEEDEEVSTEARIVEIRPDAIVFEVTTAPEATVMHRPSLETAEADASGKARLEVPANRAAGSTDFAATFEATSSGLFGSRELGSAELALGFDPLHLSRLPSAQTSSWVRLFDGSAGETCMRLFDYEGGSPEQLGDATVTSAGATLVGPPGTTVQLGAVSLTLPEAGFLRWQPSDEELAQLFTPEVLVQLPVVVTSPDRPAVEGRVSMNKGVACEARVGAGLRERLSRAEQPEMERLELAVFPRLPGNLEVVLPPGATRPPDARYDRAAYVALESEVSRRDAAEECTSEAYEVIDVRTKSFLGARSVELRPSLVSTEVTLRRVATGETLAERTFDPPSVHGCQEEVFPDTQEIRRWIREQLRTAG